MARIKMAVLSKKAYTKKKAVRKGVNKLLPKDSQKVEKKYFDLTASQVADSTGGISLINGIGQNTTNNSRIGNRIHLKSVAYDTLMLSGALATDAAYRIMLVYDKEVNSNGTLPAILGAATTDAILDSNSGTAVSAKLNINNVDRYVVLSDKVYNMKHSAGFNGVGLAGFPMIIPNKKWKAISTFTQYNAGGAAIGQINAGALYIISLSTNPVGTTAPTCIFSTRVRFTDC